jgi:hypothetical protein
MGDGTSTTEQYYTRLQYNETTGFYEDKDMYAWKSLVPFYPYQEKMNFTGANSTYNIFSQCGLILIRMALVLKSGETVLHSPIYGFYMYGINTSDTEIEKGAIIENIHSLINMDYEFADSSLFDSEISAINIYASAPYYQTKLQKGSGIVNYSTSIVVDETTTKGEFQQMAEQPFYLIKTIESPTDDKILLTVGDFDTEIVFDGAYARVDVTTIAAGEVMPVDNFSYHKTYGTITSFNGRLAIDSPTTVLSDGHIRALALEEVSSDVGFRMDTEDGSVDGVAYRIDKSLRQIFTIGKFRTYTRGLMSYPDARANFVGGNYGEGLIMRLFKCRKNEAHNISCVFNITAIFSNGINNLFSIVVDPGDPTKFITEADYSTTIEHTEDELIGGPQDIIQASYRSENRLQLSAAGEFSVFPAINSYRIGEGKIMRVCVNSVNPADTDLVSPLIIGCSDGIFTVNLDPTGSILVSSITKTKNIPFISSEILQVDGNVIFVSDKGLMAINNGDPINLTKDFFPDQGDGNFPVNETVFPSYNVLTTDFFGGAGNPYALDDIITYMRGAIFAYDARRKTIWCSNADYNFSLLFNVRHQSWGMSTLVFNDAPEFYSTLTTGIGDVYSRFMIKPVEIVAGDADNLRILSGEDLSTEVDYHILTRAIKFQNPDTYKKIDRIFSRCVLLRNTAAGYFSFGVWGKQDNNRYKKALTIASKKDNTAALYPNDVRQDIPINCRKGKYKSIVILQSGKALPDSSIDSFDFEAMLVDNSKMR